LSKYQIERQSREQKNTEKKNGQTRAVFRF